MCTPSILADEPSRTWEGTWSNRKYNTTGPLRCTAVQAADGTWTATFEGTFLGDPFKYPAQFLGRPRGRGQELAGTAQLDGDRYEWSGNIQGDTMTGEFRSLKGNNGRFVLKEKR
jgi:hypothetical protein